MHQDGLVHISALSEKFVKDPREAVKAGDVVKVKVMEVDIPRKRVGLSMRMSDTPGEKVEGNRGGGRGQGGGLSMRMSDTPGEKVEGNRGGGRGQGGGRQQPAPRQRETATAAPANNAMAALFANAKQLKKK
ncbi:uncharacterized protein F478_02958 [Pseudomonas sp. URIL14HWK12:I2]|nr:uncharacterized protein F478_02958 [Pseudomonas sp. URIL14HWK12:I2]